MRLKQGKPFLVHTKSGGSRNQKPLNYEIETHEWQGPNKQGRK